MEFAVNLPMSVGEMESTELIFADQISWDIQKDFATEIERLGYDGIAAPDHLMTGSGQTECLTSLAALAVATDRVYLYPKTINNTIRHGPMLAKYAATIDNISGGRLKLGMGAGWHEGEAKAYGFEWPDGPDRLYAMEETIEIMKGLWRNDTFTYNGDYYSVSDAACKPHPVQQPHPPIMVGGGGEEFTLRIAAQHADTWNYHGTTELLEHKLTVLKDHCDTYNRDYGTIEKSWFGRCLIRESESEVEEVLEKVPRFREENFEKDEHHLVGTPEKVIREIREYNSIGFDEIVVEFIDFPEVDGAKLFAEEVIPVFE